MKPMLAYNKPYTLEELQYPVIASPKIDGVRCLIVDGVAVSRSLKPIRNKYVQSILGRPELNGLDGELVVGDPTDPDVYLKTNSGVMSIEGEPDFTYLVFDRWDRGESAWSGSLDALNSCYIHEFIRCHSPEEVLAYESHCLEQGYEGLILRYPDAPYKFGRSTLKEGSLLKRKKFDDAEATVISLEEAMHNDNLAKKDNLGHTKRSQSQEGRTRGKGILGRIIARSPEWEHEFEIGSFKGLSNEDKQAIWENRDQYVGRTVKFKHFSHGAKDRPRHPVFLGWRDEDDC